MFTYAKQPAQKIRLHQANRRLLSRDASVAEYVHLLNNILEVKPAKDLGDKLHVEVCTLYSHAHKRKCIRVRDLFVVRGHSKSIYSKVVTIDFSDGAVCEAALEVRGRHV